MKKKLFIAIATGVFMIAMMVNLSVAQMNSSNNLSLDNIKLMTSALAEKTGNDCPGGRCSTTFASGNTCSACCADGQSATCDDWECRCD